MGVNGSALHYDEYGDGPPVVVLHGLFGSGRNWRSVATRLAESHRMYAVDLRNHGRSPHHDDMSYEAMAADVTALIEHLGHVSVNLMGHSMGGKVAMRMALKEPALVDKLVIVDIAPAAYPPRFEDLVDAMESLPLERVKRRSEADGWLAERVPDPTLRMFLLQNLAVVDGRFEWRVNLPPIRRALTYLTSQPGVPEGGRYAGPVRFIRGALSPAIGPEHEGAITDLFPAARIETIDGADHLPHVERPEEFLAVLRAFLAIEP